MTKGISSGKFVDLALTHSLGAGKKPDVTCKFWLEECGGSRRDFMVGNVFGGIYCLQGDG